MQLLDFQNIYLVGIKGVALTSLAQCLRDAGKQVRGSDVAENFVTQPILDKLQIKIDTSFETELPPETECVVYTAAHQGAQNPQVQQALAKNLPTFSHAEALSHLFNEKQGIAVCGVGGKSTSSAMIVWILEQTGHPSSFSVGVGNIPGLGKTGQWRADSQYFVSEADEYVANPVEVQQGAEGIPRFSYLQPWLTVCTNLNFDHPDVYRDFDHTQQVFLRFFKQIQPDGHLVINGDDQALRELAQAAQVSVTTVGASQANDVYLHDYTASPGQSRARLTIDNQTYDLTLQLPGFYNLHNAALALAVTAKLGVSLDQAISALASFRSTQRRFENLGVKNGVQYFDDYAHHPREVAAAIDAIRSWYPDQRIVIAFQPHTFSRTKELFNDFVEALATAPELVLLDIFASARESDDPSVSSNKLAEAITARRPNSTIQTLPTPEALAQYCQTQLHPGDVFVTLGAGDIYQVHDLLT